jgi:hypothetical protein
MQLAPLQQGGRGGDPARDGGESGGAGGARGGGGGAHNLQIQLTMREKMYFLFSSFDPCATDQRVAAVRRVMIYRLYVHKLHMSTLLCDYKLCNLKV